MNHTRKIIVLVIAGLFFATSMSTLTTKSELGDYNLDFISLSYDFGEPSIKTTEVYGETFTQLSFDGCDSSQVPGCPILPVKTVKMLLPPSSSVGEITVEASDKVTLSLDYDVVLGGTTYYTTSEPSLCFHINADGTQTLVDPNSTEFSTIGSSTPYYDQSKPYSPSDKLYSEPFIGYQRGYPICFVNLYPCQYDASSSSISYYKHMTLNVELEKNSLPINNNYRGLKRDKALIAGLVDNPSMLYSYDGYSALNTLSSDEPVKMVIITTEALKNTYDAYNLQALAAAHGSRGLSVEIKTVEEIYDEYNSTIPWHKTHHSDTFGKDIDDGTEMHISSSIVASHMYIDPTLNSLAFIMKSRYLSSIAGDNPNTTANESIWNYGGIDYTDQYYLTDMIRNYITDAYKDGADYVLLAGSDDMSWTEHYSYFGIFPMPLDNIKDYNEVPTPLLYTMTLEFGVFITEPGGPDESGLSQPVDPAKPIPPISPPIPPDSSSSGSNDAPVAEVIKADSYEDFAVDSFESDVANYSYQTVYNDSNMTCLLTGFSDLGGQQAVKAKSNIITVNGKWHLWTFKMFTASDDAYYGHLDGNREKVNPVMPGSSNNIPWSTYLNNGPYFNDLLSEVYVGRASVTNSQELSNFVKKTIDYMNTPADQNPDTLLVGEHLGFGGLSEYAGPTLDELKGGSNHNGWTTAGLPDLTTYTLYDNSEKSWSKATILSKINCAEPPDIINHLGHGNWEKVLKLDAEEDIWNIKNPQPIFLYSQACMSGAYNYGCLYDTMPSGSCGVSTKQWMDFVNGCSGTGLARSGLGPEDSRASIAEMLINKQKYVRESDGKLISGSGTIASVMNTNWGFGWVGSTDGPSQRYNRAFWDAVYGDRTSTLGAALADSKDDNVGCLLGQEDHPSGCKTCSDPNYAWCMLIILYDSNLLGDPALEPFGVGTVFSSPELPKPTVYGTTKVDILAPTEKYLYLRNMKICPFFTTLILGSLEINATINDTSGNVTTIKFIIDTTEVANVSYNASVLYYSCKWNEKAFFKRINVKVSAVNAENKEISSSEIKVLIFNLAHA